MFLCEQATLNYNVGNFDEAISNFNEIDIKDAIYYDMEISLLHGCSDIKIKEEVADSIEKLKKINSVYGYYWEYHILSEQGVFEMEKLRDVHKQLLDSYELGERGLTATLFERCITDEMRWMWILQDSPYDKAKLKKYKDRCQYLQNIHAEKFAKHNNVDYYSSLYFVGGNIHYHVIPMEMWVENQYKDNSGDIKYNSSFIDEFKKAVNCYNRAIESPLDKQKSKYAAKVKLADLLSMSDDCDYIAQENVVNNFKSYAIKQKIDVFVAFANTLLAKLKILRLVRERFRVQEESCKEIINLLDSAKATYTEYKNVYGVNRCQYIKIIFNILINFSDNSMYEKSLLELLNCKNNSDGIVCNFIDKIINCTDRKFQDFYHSIKFYPIILQ